MLAVPLPGLDVWDPGVGPMSPEASLHGWQTAASARVLTWPPLRALSWEQAPPL